MINWCISETWIVKRPWNKLTPKKITAVRIHVMRSQYGLQFFFSNELWQSTLTCVNYMLEHKHMRKFHLYNWSFQNSAVHQYVSRGPKGVERSLRTRCDFFHFSCDSSLHTLHTVEAIRSARRCQAALDLQIVLGRICLHLIPIFLGWPTHSHTSTHPDIPSCGSV